MTCSCGKETDSFYDVIGPKGKIKTVPSCPGCFKKIREGMRPLKDGFGYVHGQVQIRWFKRDYKPMTRTAWAFFTAQK